MTTRAYGKINLGLRILRKRPDGFHDIESVFHYIDLFDELTFRLHEREILLNTTHPDLHDDRTNLCVRAANLLRDLTGTPDGVEISLHKNIPLGAGLGGGSSDAAATLKCLRTLWNLDISDAEMHTLAATLGSDVPFFLDDRSAYATGRGEILEPLSLRLSSWIIVCTPPIHVSTANAYKKLSRTGESLPVTDLKSLLVERGHDPAALRGVLVNDFEPVVFSQHPEILAIRETMLRLGAECALLTGSGSSVFALTRSEPTAQTLLRELEGAGRVFATRPYFSLQSTETGPQPS